MQNLRLLELLESVLGTSRKKAKGNHGFNCPFPDCKHDSYKLEIDLSKKDESRWHCWRCDRKGTKLQYLFRQINVSPAKVEELNKLTDYKASSSDINQPNTPQYSLHLPKEYKPLWVKAPSFEYSNAIHYALRVRKLTPQDIIKHEIGYCETGEYAKKLIIPSYDSSGTLNFFTARAYYKDEKYPHKNPPISKDIIGFDLFVNWNLPVTIVEGPLDAISAKQNAIPLFGKIILKKLKQKLRSAPAVYIALDPDALKKSVRSVEELMKEGIDVYLMNLDGADPNKMGSVAFQKLKNNTEKITFKSLVKYKMLLGNI